MSEVDFEPRAIFDGLVGDVTLEGNQYALITKVKITNVAGTIKYYAIIT